MTAGLSSVCRQHSDGGLTL